MTLKKEWIQVFVRDLNACKHISDFDVDFLMISEESLYTHDKSQWLSSFKKRHSHLLGTEYDWVHSTADPRDHWSTSNTHSNYHWYELAKKIAELYGLDVTAVIFPDIDICSKDRKDLAEKPQTYADLYYNDTSDRLMSISRIFMYLSRNPSQQFASYDIQGNTYPFSLREAIQIQDKSQVNQDGLTYWGEIEDLQISEWTSHTAFLIDDLIYPLFRIVQAYFCALKSEQSMDETRELLQLLYDNELKALKDLDANCFYGQKVPVRVGSNGNQRDYLINILTRMYRCHSLQLILPQMVDLAVWITTRNPAMIIAHPLVDGVYKSLELGVYFTSRNLGDQLSILFRHRARLSEDEINKIHRLISLSAKANNEEAALLASIKELFSIRARYNQTETFIERKEDQIIRSSFEYLYYRKGINLQYVRIAQFLQGSGFLKRHNIEDYFLLLMPSLETSYDPVSAKFWSEEPLSHYIWPEGDRRYLIGLFNSLKHYAVENKCFYNVNALKRRALTVSEHQHIQLYAAKKFCGFPRLPPHTQYVLHASTLKSLIDLVNQSLNYEGLEDRYTLSRGIPVRAEHIKLGCVYYSIDTETIHYKVRDSWCHDVIHQGKLSIDSNSSTRDFLELSSQKKLTYILNMTSKSGHTRPNFSVAKYYKSCIAYEKFREIYNKLPADERDRLNHVTMRFDNTLVRTFYEIWSDGYPDCMSAASKWFSTLIIDYLPELKFDVRIESDSTQSKYLQSARRTSQNLYQQNKIVNDLGDLSVDLNEFLTHISSRGNFRGIFTRGLYLCGMDLEDDLPIPEELFIVDQSPASRPIMSYLSQSMFNSNQSVIGSGNETDIESRTVSHCSTDSNVTMIRAKS